MESQLRQTGDISVRFSQIIFLAVVFASGAFSTSARAQSLPQPNVSVSGNSYMNYLASPQHQCEQAKAKFAKAVNAFWGTCGAASTCLTAFLQCSSNPNAVVKLKLSKNIQTNALFQSYGGLKDVSICSVGNGTSVKSLRRDIRKNQSAENKLQQQLMSKKKDIINLQADIQKQIEDGNKKYQKQQTNCNNAINTGIPQKYAKKAQKIQNNITKIGYQISQLDVKEQQVIDGERLGLQSALDKCQQYALTQLQSDLNQRASQIATATRSAPTFDQLVNGLGRNNQCIDTTLSTQNGEMQDAQCYYNRCRSGGDLKFDYTMAVDSARANAQIKLKGITNEINLLNTQLQQDQYQAQVLIPQQEQQEKQQIQQQCSQALQNIQSKYMQRVQKDYAELNLLTGGTQGGSQNQTQQLTNMLDTALSGDKKNQQNIYNGLNPAGQISLSKGAGVDSQIGLLNLDLQALQQANTSMLEAEHAQNGGVKDKKNFLPYGQTAITDARSAIDACAAAGVQANNASTFYCCFDQKAAAGVVNLNCPSTCPYETSSQTQNPTSGSSGK